MFYGDCIYIYVYGRDGWIDVRNSISYKEDFSSFFPEMYFQKCIVLWSFISPFPCLSSLEEAPMHCSSSTECNHNFTAVSGQSNYSHQLKKRNLGLHVCFPGLGNDCLLDEEG